MIEDAIRPGQLEVLCAECARLKAEVDNEMALAGRDTNGLCLRDKRYSIMQRYKSSRHLESFISGALMRAVCRATMGDRAYLFTEQFLLKGPHSEMDFNWHQDSAYVGFAHEPFAICWCALDDVRPENGSIHILPFSRAPSRDLQL